MGFEAENATLKEVTSVESMFSSGFLLRITAWDLWTGVFLSHQVGGLWVLHIRNTFGLGWLPRCALLILVSPRLFFFFGAGRESI